MTGETRPSILVVDDEIDLLEILELELKDAGYDVACAGSGDEAVGRTRKQHFDLVLTDFKMPGMDGLETLAALEKVDPQIRAVVMTGFASEELRTTLQNRGRPLVRKPFDVDELLETLHGALSH
jgi:CheY-like chemotaxis protein